MQIIMSFSLSPQEYRQRFDSFVIPHPDICPFCKAQGRFYRHGCYFRNVLDVNIEERIPILRFCCQSCGHTVSVLPSFILPYFQYSLIFILSALRLILMIISQAAGAFAPLFRFYRRRFFRNLNAIEMFFREEDGWEEESSADKKGKAIKFVCMLGSLPRAETFSQRFHKHYKRNFMAY